MKPQVEILEDDDIEISNHIEDSREFMIKNINSYTSFVEKNVSILNSKCNQINLSSNYDMIEESSSNYTNSIHENRSLQYFKDDKMSEIECKLI